MNELKKGKPCLDRLDFSGITRRPAATPPISPRIKLTGPNLDFIDLKKIIAGEYNSEDFCFNKTIGVGNAGKVEKYTHKPSNIVLVKKTYDICVKETLRGLIVRELQQMHDYNSEFILGFYGAFNFDGFLCVMSEYMDIGSTELLLYKYAGRFPESFIVIIAKNIVNGLKYLRKNHNCPHRNLKPSNVLLNSSGGVRLGDMSSSSQLSELISSSYLAIKCYLDPQSLIGDQQSFPCDIWSLGVILMEYCFGEYPVPQPQKKHFYESSFSKELADNDSIQVKAMNEGLPLPKIKNAVDINSEQPITIFEILAHIVEQPAPRLPRNCFTEQFSRMVHSCLMKAPVERCALQSLDAQLSKFDINDDDHAKAQNYVTKLMNQG